METKNTMPEIEQMFKQATDFFNTADAFCKKYKQGAISDEIIRLQNELSAETLKLTEAKNTIAKKNLEIERLQNDLSAEMIKSSNTKNVIAEKDKEIVELKQKVDEAKSLADWEKHLKEEAECTVHAQAEQLVSGATRSNTWHTIDDDKRPLDGEQVLVATANGTKYLQTYFSECGFTKEVAYWMTIPEIN